MARAASKDTKVAKTISRAEVRAATIHGLHQVRADSRSIKLTVGQRQHITGQRTATA